MDLRSQRPALVVLAVVAVLAVGVALGSILRLPLTEPGVPVPAADSVDVGFAQDMTVHHEQAVQIANQAMSRSQDPVVQSLAFDIFTSQERQIGQMQGWLNLWDRALLPQGGHMGWMAGSSHHGTGGEATVAVMPGMASSAELAELRAATGPALDVLFLQLMLRHHAGGAEMLTYAADHAVSSVVRQFAASVASTQRSEQENLTSLLAERGGTPLPVQG